MPFPARCSIRGQVVSHGGELPRHLFNALLPSFLVTGVLATPAAVLLQLQPLAGVALALCCHIVATLAFIASHRQRWSLVRSHLLARSYSSSKNV